MSKKKKQLNSLNTEIEIHFVVSDNGHSRQMPVPQMVKVYGRPLDEIECLVRKMDFIWWIMKYSPELYDAAMELINES